MSNFENLRNFIIISIPYFMLVSTFLATLVFSLGFWLRSKDKNDARQVYLVAGVLNVTIFLICAFYLTVLIQSVLDWENYKLFLVATFVSGLTASTKAMFEALNQDLKSKFEARWFLYYVIRPVCGGLIGGILAWALFSMVLTANGEAVSSKDYPPLIISAASFGWLWEKVQSALGSSREDQQQSTPNPQTIIVHQESRDDDNHRAAS
ncbi:hypothetical protein [Pseudobacteriovorax antillogorgiicola]|uniref:Uncharacterized protein n=1 Tax=Pseudobacteriovorax antillogorgiicola TaxID=1513793 RepID=A0A1Y6CHI5_9BACT|nr:hypothetical protein [Pseudobacteriovorax antillogorgiicola]TCS48975.1 hypothetical protein EDD56_11617 [Pseudobacteriovorax antillogorgiicola]SMF53542.1 hypothetical protein SAMN06296036_116137 [Pseudobacteriovorax antillogorgiicola]